jgi:hypothetical protein
MSVLSFVRSTHSAEPFSAIRRESRARQAAVLIGLGLTLLALGLETLRYFTLGAYLDHIEGSVTISAWQYAAGQPLYQVQGGLPRFATYYGPLAYLVELPALLLSPTIAASKAAPLLALLATIGLMAAHFMRQSRPAAAFHAVFFLLAGLLLFGPVSFWVRPDPFETLAVAAAVVFGASPLIVAICLGLAVNLKAHAFLYFLPIVVDLVANRGLRVLVVLVLVSGVAFLLPFLAPGISLHDYIASLSQQVAGRAQTSTQLIWTVVCLIGLLLPVLLPLFARRQLSRDTTYAAASLAALALLVYPATFPGSGSYHFLPLLPVLAEARRRPRPHGIGAEFAPFPLLFLATVVVQHNSQLMMARAGWAALSDEAVTLARFAPTQAVQIGYGDSRRSYEVSQLSRTKLALAGSPAIIDAQVLMELRQIGADGSQRWIADLDDCRIDRWVLPKDEEPFGLHSYFYDNAPVFGDGFRRAFMGHYRPAVESPHFIAWECPDGR